MTYQPLARKYRPEKFSELIGQEMTSLALLNSIRIQREPTAVLFSGVRGVGKTTLARLYAKALNCENPSSGEPCNECSSCLMIKKSCHEDVLEIDGASNNGVDEVRAVKEMASYVTQRSRYRIYIIDEVHMLSISAFNALLKILEEPPEKVIFIFATTELQKVPQTVLSRCQSFFLQKIPFQKIYERLETVLKKEEILYESKALRIIAQEGQGSMRDALTFLDKIIAIGGGKADWEALTKVVTNLSALPYIKLVFALTEYNVEVCMDVIDKLDQRGLEFRKVVGEVAKLARHGFMIKNLGSSSINATRLGLDDREYSVLMQLARNCPPLLLNKIFTMMVQCQTELDDSGLDRFVVENYCMEWCLSQGVQPLTPQKNIDDGKLDPVDGEASTGKKRDEVRQNSGNASSTAQLKEEERRDQSAAHSYENAPPPGQMPDSWASLVSAWKRERPLQARKLEELYPIEYGPQLIRVEVDPDGFVGPSLLQKQNQEKLAEQFRSYFGFKGEFQAFPRKSAQGGKTAQQSLKRKEPELTSETRNDQSVRPGKAAAGPMMDSERSVPAAGESLLTIKQREKDKRRQEMIAKAHQHPLTRSIVETMGGQIVKTDIDPESLV